MRSPAPRPAQRSFADPSGNILGSKATVRPYALLFSVFLFFSFFSPFVILFFFFSPFQFLLILLFLSTKYVLCVLIPSYYSRRAILRLLILLLLYFKQFVVLQTCILIICICTHIRHSEGFTEGAKPFLSSYSSLLITELFVVLQTCI